MTGQTMEAVAQLVGGPKCGETLPIFRRAVDLIAAGKTYTVRIPASETASARIMDDTEIYAPTKIAVHVYELRFRPDRHDGTVMRAVLWYRGLQCV